MSGAAKAGTARSDILRGYRPVAGTADELMGADGALRPVWRPFIDYLAAQDEPALLARFARGDQHLRDAGVFYRQHSGGTSTERDWPLSHIPVLIDRAEWQGLVEGLVQRAELLERVMADLYGPGRLVSDGLLPPQLIAQNPEWLRPLVGVTPREGHYLHVVAFEVGRSPDGSWFVLGDRTQAPSGAGFALENRIATSRVFPDFYAGANVERLAGYFRRFRDAMVSLRGDGEGRVGILTPGSETDTYFEHAYIARYLGFSLLECEDLKVEHGQLMVRTITGPSPISVLWRRLDSSFADPLELDHGSALGTPGMVSAIRAGNLTLANALGSGVLEARAFLSFLPAIAETLMGEALKLPNIATWWCGQRREREYVKANAARMMIGPAMNTALPFEVDSSTAFGGQFRGTARKSVAAWIDEDGANLVGQEAVTLSTTPAWDNGRLRPRPMTVRVFAARTRDGWTVMPGGYARIGQSDDVTALAMRSGGSVADVWIVSDRPVAKDTLTPPVEGPFVRAMPGVLPARSADNLYWLGRYVERCEGLVRKHRAYHLRLEETRDPAAPLLQLIAGHLRRFGADPAQPVPDAVRAQLDNAIGCAGKVRDRFSIDGWMALRDLSKTARAIQATAQPGDDAAGAMSVLLRKLAGFSGLVHENMYRFAGWRFLTIGRALERADLISSVLADFADPAAPDGSPDVAVEVGDSVLTHKRRFPVETSRVTVLDLLALDQDNPRSLIYQLNDLRQQIDALPGAMENGLLSDLSRYVLRLHTDVAVARPPELTSEHLRGIRKRIAGLSDLLTQTYFA